MDKNTFLEALILEISYRSKEGYPDLNKPEHISLLSEILDDWGVSEMKDELINNLISEAPEEEEETDFQHPVLDREVEYEDSEGNRKTGKVGNLLRQPENTPPRDAAEAELRGLSDEEKEKINRELGSQRGNETDPDMEFDGEKEDSEGESGGEQGQEQPKQGTALDPDTEAGKDYRKTLSPNDPAYIGDEDGEEKKTKAQKKQELSEKDNEVTDEQLTMTKKEAKAQAKKKGKKGVGAGTPESRAGEAMVHKGLRMMQDGNDLETIEKDFRNLVNQKGHILNSSSGKKWVDATMASLKQIDRSIGIDNVDTVSWDTPEGREAIGVSKDLETSSDMFVRTKDGKNIGVSLKKTGKVFLNNGGWAKQSKKLLNKLQDTMPEDDHKRLAEAMSLDAYQEDLDSRFNEVTEDIDADTLREDFEKLQNDEENLKRYFSGSSRDKYFDALSNPEKLIKRLNQGVAYNYEQKAYVKVLQSYHQEKYDYLRETDNGLTQRTFDVLNSSPTAKLGMNKHIIKSMHVAETLGLNKEIQEGGVNNFVTVYGIEPDGAILDESSLITLFGSDFKQKLNEVVTEVRDGNGDYSDIEEFISNQIEINYDTGEILFHHESNKKFPLFYMSGRARGIGESPVMEMAQTSFMAHALKVGTFNVDEWDEESLERFEKDIQDVEKDEEDYSAE